MENKNNFMGIIIPVVIAVILLTVLPIVNSINKECPPCDECPIYNIGNKEVNPDFSSGNYLVDNGSYDYLDSVTIIKDEDLIPENIKKDVNIFGVVGTLESGEEGTLGGIYFPKNILYSGNTVEITITGKTTVTMNSDTTNYEPLPSDWIGYMGTLNITITNNADNPKSTVGILYGNGYDQYIRFESSTLAEFSTTMDATINSKTIIVINTYAP